jgi:hypothetical protein
MIIMVSPDGREHLLFFMRATTIQTNATIAVVAKNSKSGWHPVAF